MTDIAERGGSVRICIMLNMNTILFCCDISGVKCGKVFSGVKYGVQPHSVRLLQAAAGRLRDVRFVGLPQRRARRQCVSQSRQQDPGSPKWKR